MGELKDKFNKMKGKRNQAGSPPYYVNELLEDIVDKLESGGSGSSMININYADLVNLRDNSGLIPGQQYRITDYVATTADPESRSANHPFDIIVTADDVNILNENARAIQHEGDDYFNYCNLSAWKLKYNLDNDDYNYSWAKKAHTRGIIAMDRNGKIITYYTELISENDTTYEGFPYVFDVNRDGTSYLFCSPYKEFNTPTTCKAIYDKGTELEESSDIVINSISIEIVEGGKGVIYEMIDEFNNKARFDFKGLQIKRYKVIACDEFPNIIGQYYNNGFYANYTVDLEDYQYRYLFNIFTDQNIDATTNNNFLNIYDCWAPNNCIIEGYITDGIVCNVNFNDLGYYSVYNFTIKSSNCNIDIGNCYEFTIDYYNDSLIIQNDCDAFTVGVGNQTCIIGDFNRGWHMGDQCLLIMIDKDCCYWTMGQRCRYIICPENCSYWSCGIEADSLSWSKDCSYFHILNGVASGILNVLLHIPFKDNVRYCQYAAFKTKDNVSASEMEVVVFNIADLV